MGRIHTVVGSIVVAWVVALGSTAGALPIELRDQNGTRYHVNTDVDPLITNSLASGALTNATFEKPVTVTSYFVGLTPFGLFFTTYTVQRPVDVPLTDAFAGFNGLLIAGVNGAALPSPLVYNPGEGLASEDCPQNNQNRQLNFQPQSFPAVNLQVTRKAFVPHNSDFVRWLNVVTNTGSTPTEVGITLQGLLGARSQTKVNSTSDGDSTITAGDLWFTSGQSVPQGQRSTEPTIGFVVQGAGATTPARSLGINSVGQTVATYTPTIPPGASAIVMTFATVQTQGKKDTAKSS